MTTETIQLAAATAAAPAPVDWRSAQQLATDATWQASGAVPYVPFCVSQINHGAGTYIGDLHYTQLAAVLGLAAEYDVPVEQTPVSGGEVRVTARVTIDGIEVRAWTYVQASELPVDGEAV